MRPGRATDHLSPSSAVIEEYSYNSTHLLDHTGPVTGSLYLPINMCNCKQCTSWGRAIFFTMAGLPFSFNKMTVGTQDTNADN